MKTPFVKVKSLQETYLNNIIAQRILVSVYLKSSIRLKGFLIFYNEESVFLKNGDALQMIYKNAMTTICPETVFENYETQKSTIKLVKKI